MGAGVVGVVRVHAGRLSEWPLVNGPRGRPCRASRPSSARRPARAAARAGADAAAGDGDARSTMAGEAHRAAATRQASAQTAAAPPPPSMPIARRPGGTWLAPAVVAHTSPTDVPARSVAATDGVAEAGTSRVHTASPAREVPSSFNVAAQAPGAPSPSRGHRAHHKRGPRTRALSPPSARSLVPRTASLVHSKTLCAGRVPRLEHVARSRVSTAPTQPRRHLHRSQYPGQPLSPPR